MSTAWPSPSTAPGAFAFAVSAVVSLRPTGPRRRRARGRGMDFCGVRFCFAFRRTRASEEALLQSQFGAEYNAYRARTWRLIP